jgi:hypothetical protein
MLLHDHADPRLRTSDSSEGGIHLLARATVAEPKIRMRSSEASSGTDGSRLRFAPPPAGGALNT